MCFIRTVRLFYVTIYISPTCGLKIANGIGIGSTREEVFSAYSTDIIKSGTQLTSDWQPFCLYILLKNDVVYSIYIGTEAGTEEYFDDFFPDRETGFPLDALAVDEINNSQDCLFYLGQPKERVMSLISYYNVPWRETINDSMGSTVVADEFIFVFDSKRELSCIAVDEFTSPRYCVRATIGKGINTKRSMESAEWDYGNDYIHEFIEVDDLLYNYEYSYDKYTYDMGGHDFFICAKDGRIIRWGICEKR